MDELWIKGGRSRRAAQHMTAEGPVGGPLINRCLVQPCKNRKPKVPKTKFKNLTARGIT